jgi:multiple sugar transport system ATP-binding protein
MAPVSIRGVRKAYGAQQVIHGVDIDIGDGEFVILVGPSGCGKSTLLRMIAGLEEISEGRVDIGGRVVNALSPKERNIAMVFQNYALYPQMTVAQNLAFSLEIAGMKKPEIRRKVEEAAEILSLTPLLGRKPSQLSGGQRQRVAMGRAIVRDPDVFLFDEPLSNLDAKLRVQMRAEIKALHQRLESTIVYVTHDQIEAMTMADKIVVMNAGRVEQFGSPLELYDKPTNMFVAGFLGSPSMNFIDGRSEAGGLRTKDGTLIDLGAIPVEGQGKALVYGIRPEHLEIVSEGGHVAKVLLVEPTGAETHIVLEIAGTEMTGVFKDRLDVRPGQTMQIAFVPGKGHLFMHEGGRRLEGAP